jgi:23S rRNA pseudouridine1911/1915/1917 synthase
MTESVLEMYRRLGPPVGRDDEGERVDAYLARSFPFLSRSGWLKRIADGRLLVNGRTAKKASRLRYGDELHMHAPPMDEPEVDRDLRVLWRDGAVMAVYKPGNLPMHENGPYRKNTFTNLVWEEFGREWAAVHRLDRETSGIVICGATAEVRGRLASDFQSRRMRKEYLAIARGVPAVAKWIADGPIGDLTESAIRIKKWVVPGGLPATTEFEVEDAAAGATLLRARPLTGRTNQIRIHAAHAGHVLYGDKLYHDDEAVFLEYFEKGLTPSVVRRSGFARLCLHAAALELTHPETKRLERVECELPHDMAAFWAARRRSTLRDACPSSSPAPPWPEASER